MTRCLADLAAGVPGAGDALFGLLYDELRLVAAAAMQRERGEHTLQPTALVHEVWLRVLGGEQSSFADRNHFLRSAALAMRHILVDHARHRATLRFEADGRRTPLEDWLVVIDERKLDILALHEALAALEEADADLARLVELRFFGGLTVAEIASSIGRSTASVERDWRVARALLSRWLDDREEPRA